jgi:putative nucleotidyltransferase with HDIG domain
MEDRIQQRTDVCPAEVMGLIGDLPPLPQVASRVIALVEDPDTSGRDITEVIAADQALTAKILRASNSAYYGRSGKISTLSQAVMLLGFQAIRNLVLVHSLPFGSSAAQSQGQNLQQVLWEHSLSTALSARLMAAKRGYYDPEVAFVAGLLHDAGQIVFVMKHPAEFNSILAKAKTSDLSISELEQEALGFDHAVVGSKVLERWNLPALLVEAVAVHHEPHEPGPEGDLAVMTAAASALTNSLGMGLVSPEQAAAELTRLLEVLALDADAMEEVQTRMLAAVQEERALFNM